MQKPFEVRGVIVPLLTPLSRDGEQVDERALQAHVEWLVKQGVHGLMPCGTTGEGPLLTQAEREIITEIVADAAAGRVPVIAHVGAITTQETVELAEHAAAVGVAAISAITPYYFARAGAGARRALLPGRRRRGRHAHVPLQSAGTRRQPRDTRRAPRR